MSESLKLGGARNPPFDTSIQSNLFPSQLRRRSILGEFPTEVGYGGWESIEPVEIKKKNILQIETKNKQNLSVSDSDYEIKEFQDLL